MVTDGGGGRLIDGATTTSGGHGEWRRGRSGGVPKEEDNKVEDEQVAAQPWPLDPMAKKID